MLRLPGITRRRTDLHVPYARRYFPSTDTLGVYLFTGNQTARDVRCLSPGHHFCVSYTYADHLLYWLIAPNKEIQSHSYFPRYSRGLVHNLENLRFYYPMYVHAHPMVPSLALFHPELYTVGAQTGFASECLVLLFLSYECMVDLIQRNANAHQISVAISDTSGRFQHRLPSNPSTRTSHGLSRA